MNASIDFREERMNRGLSVEAMAEQAGVAPHVWRHIEAGGRPQPRNALAIATFFQLKVTEVWPLESVVTGPPESNGEAA